jgi:hypothetical protein
MTKVSIELMKELQKILDLSRRHALPEDGDIAGWEPVAVNRLALIERLAIEALRRQRNLLAEIEHELGPRDY